MGTKNYTQACLVHTDVAVLYPKAMVGWERRM